MIWVFAIMAGVWVCSLMLALNAAAVNDLVREWGLMLQKWRGE